MSAAVLFSRPASGQTRCASQGRRAVGLPARFEFILAENDEVPW